MFDKLEDLLIRFEEIMGELHEPTVTNNQERFRKLMKEQSDLTPIVDAYTEYKKCKQDIEDSLSMLEEEKDEEMREMIKETLNDSKKRVEELEQELKILLLPKDPNDDKNVIVEIRAGAGGDEAALFAAEIYRMYVHYAEKQRWKVELINVDEIGIGGMKEVQFTISGQGAYSKMKYESGVHRVQRVPETESGGRIHTSTISVAVMPEAHTLLIVGAMTFGIVIAIRLGNVADFTTVSLRPDNIYFSQAIAAAISSMGFSIIFNIPRRLLPVVAVGGIITVLLRNVMVLQLGFSQTAGSFLNSKDRKSVV